MQLRRTLLASAVLVAAAAASPAQEVGTYVPPLVLEEFGNSPAQGLEDYYGRTVLLEFFAYW